MTVSLEELIELDQKDQLVGRFFENIPNDVYHHLDCPGISKSGLDQIRRSYDHYLAYKNQDDSSEKSRSLVLGSAVHDSILEPEVFDRDYVVRPNIDRRTKIGKDKWATFCKQAYDKEILSKDEMHKVKMMELAVSRHHTCSKLLANSKKEIAGFFRVNSVLCKFKADIYKEGGFLADLKTTDNASANAFNRSMVKYSYDKQAAFYSDGVKAITGLELPFYFIAVEKTPPYGIALYKLNNESLAVGRGLYLEDIDKYINAMMFSEETGYPLEVQDIELPGWGFDPRNR